MSQNTEETNLFDPTGMWRGMRDAGIEAWSRAMLQLMASKEYRQLMETTLDAYLASSEPFRKLVESVMTQVVTSEAFTKTTRDMLDLYLANAEPMRVMLLQLVTSEAYTQATMKMLDTYLRDSAPLRQMIETTMKAVLEQMLSSPRAAQATLIEQLDPLGIMRSTREATMEAWMGVMAGAPLRQMIESTMGQVLGQLNMPTRADVLGISERLSRIEERLDKLEEKSGPA